MTAQHTVIDGVEVYWEQGPAPMVATLTAVAAVDGRVDPSLVFPRSMFEG